MTELVRGEHLGRVPERYDLIDRANEHSWYMTDGRPLEVFQSVGTLKPSARLFGEQATRMTLAGNMSELYPKTDAMTDDERYTAALGNMMRFYRDRGLTPQDMTNTVILYPQREYGIPLKSVNVDENRNESSFIEPMIAHERADFMYTRDPDRLLAARPADCPIVLATGETPEGKILMLTHIAWEGAANGFVGQMFDEYDRLGVDRGSLQMFVTPGGQAESFPYAAAYDPHEKYPGVHGLFRRADASEGRLQMNADGKFAFTIDTPRFVYDELLKNGVTPEQIFADTSDTSRPDSGYSSHGRAMRSGGRETNIRDIIIAKMNNVTLNPENPAPKEIAEKIKAVPVRYLGFDGEVHEGTIEVHQDVSDDVRDFFHVAYETRFPIERVVRSSDAEYGWNDDKLMDANTSSGFNYRLIKGTDRPSLHGQGRAFDVNCRLNPYVRYVEGKALTDPEGSTYDPSVPGTLTAGHPLVVFLKERGWTWGGDWTEADHKVTDYQHFEKRA